MRPAEPRPHIAHENGGDDAQMYLKSGKHPGISRLHGQSDPHWK
jgi:hypothetical protein